MSVYIITKLNEETNRHYKKYDLPNLPNNIANIQFSIQNVKDFLLRTKANEMLVKIENEIDTEKINENSKIYHGKRHIKNVVLFSMIICVSECINNIDLKHLIYAAKYHDIGREQVGEGLIPHAELSADIAQSKLSHLSNNEIAIIQTAIAFHEFPRGSNEDIAFETLAKKHKIEPHDFLATRIISEMLKDADALDRTRFNGSGQVDVKYLSTGTAKRLIRFASLIQEQFAIEELNSFDNIGDVEFLLQILTPQEILFELQKTKTIMPEINSNKEALKFYSSCVRLGKQPYDFDAYEMLK
ncbi:MAG: HD domain-containing protein [Oscillospiraceae bacterium]|jgi:hypothetical protein|nr:HD domain-containing protein [Oscillospiraceae bacterium]